MGFALKNGDREFHFSETYWYRLLELARAYGWEPRDAIATVDGTVRIPPAYREAPSTISQTDARALAAALSRALPQLSDDDAGGKVLFASDTPLSERQVERIVHQLQARGLTIEAEDLAIVHIDEVDWAAYGMSRPNPGAVMPNFMLSPDRVYSGPDKDIVRSFILFCQKGGFDIL